MVLSAEGVRKRFLFPSEVWDVRLTPLKKCPNSIPCQALMCVFALKGASGAENFSGSSEGLPLWSIVTSWAIAQSEKAGKSRQKFGKNGEKLRWYCLN